MIAFRAEALSVIKVKNVATLRAVRRHLGVHGDILIGEFQVEKLTRTQYKRLPKAVRNRIAKVPRQ